MSDHVCTSGVNGLRLRRASKCELIVNLSPRPCGRRGMGKSSSYLIAVMHFPDPPLLRAELHKNTHILHGKIALICCALQATLESRDGVIGNENDM